MDFLIEAVFDFLFSLIYEGSLEIGTDKKVNPLLRVLALLIFGLIFGVVIAALFWVGLDVIKEGNIAAGAIFIGIDILLLIGTGWKFCKKHREQKKDL